MTMTIGAVICVVVILAGVGGLGLALLFDGSPPYPPEAAETPEQAPDVEFERARPLTEAGPFVVAGSDLDRAHQPMSLVNLTLRLMVDADPELVAMNAKAETLAGLYVAPEVDR